MAIQINQPILNMAVDANKNPLPNVDVYYGPYDSISEACASISVRYRSIGLTVGVRNAGKIDEYWWQSGTSNSNLIRKIPDCIGYQRPITGIPASDLDLSTQMLLNKISVLEAKCNDLQAQIDSNHPNIPDEPDEPVTTVETTYRFTEFYFTEVGNTVSENGGTITPIVNYVIEKTELLSDGTRRITNLNTGATKTITSSIGVVSGNSVTIPANFGEPRTITVTVKLSIGEGSSLKEEIRTQTYDQSGHVTPEYPDDPQHPVEISETIYSGFGPSAPIEVSGSGTKYTDNTVTVSVTTRNSDGARCHWVAVSQDSEFTLSKALDVDDDDITDIIEQSIVGNYRVYYLLEPVYIDNTTNFTLSK